MNKMNIKPGAQSGFTLIELIVVIVVLGILAATALPKFADLGGDARLAKIEAAVGAVRGASAMTHASWLAAGSPTAVAASAAGAPPPTVVSNSSSTDSVLTAEGAKIAFIFGYADVGGDGAANAVPVAGTLPTNSGIVVAAGGLSDYKLASTSATVLKVSVDAEHPNCSFTSPAASATTAATIDVTNATVTNCK